MPNKEASFSRRSLLRNPTIGILILSNGITMLGFGQILPIIPILLYDKLNASEIEIGLTISIFAVTRVLSQGPIGSLSDRYGRKAFIVIPLFAYGLVSIFYIFATQTWHVLAIRAFQGFFSGALWPVSDAMVMDVCEPKHRGKVISTIQIAYNTGWFTGPFVGGVISNMYGLNATFGFSAGLSFIAFVFALFFLKETVQKRERFEGVNAIYSMNFVQHFKKASMTFKKFPALKNLAVSALILYTAASLMQGYTPIFITNVLNGDELDTGLILGLTGIFSLVVQFFFGEVGDKYGKWKVLLLGVFISVLTSPLLLFVDNIMDAYIIIPLVLGANAMATPMFTALVGDALPLEARGAGYGAYGVVRDISMIIGSPLGGLVLELSRRLLYLELLPSLKILFVFRSLMLILTLTVVIHYIKSFKEVDSVIWLRSKVPLADTH
ncbi:MAG: MFS transporter [Nitrososphaeria archaeon]